MGYLRLAATLSVIGVMSASTYQPALAAPLTPLSSAARPAAEQNDMVQVRYGWGWGGWGVGAGLLAGALIGAAIAAPAYGASYPYGRGALR
jgi:hypothetical protein